MDTRQHETVLSEVHLDIYQGVEDFSAFFHLCLCQILWAITINENFLALCWDWQLLLSRDLISPTGWITEGEIIFVIADKNMSNRGYLDEKIKFSLQILHIVVTILFKTY
jgi:hypothetical protein